ncbi:ABC transporter permease [candidate division KSB1 bacterium]
MNKKNTKPPKIASWLLKRILPGYLDSSSMGDYEEIYNRIRKKEGRIRAVLWYWRQIFQSIIRYLKESTIWSITMLNNYIKIALRNIRKQKLFSFINIAGLAIGMGCCIVIFLFVQSEFIYDKFHENADRIYRLSKYLQLDTGLRGYSTSDSRLGPASKDEFPEVENAVRLIMHRGTITNYKDKRYNIDPVYADKSIFEVFTFPLLKGDPKTALNEPNTVVITEELAGKYFGNEEPIGKTITINNKVDVTVTGILKRVPENSHLHFEFLASFETLKARIGNANYQRSVSAYTHTYLLLKKDVKAEEFEKKLPEFAAKILGEKRAEGRQFFMQPLTSIHLNSELALEFEKNSNIKYSYYLSILAIAIILIACINFMNLSTASSFNRAKEVGLRKVVGASRSQVIKQFLSESIIMSIFAVVIALIIAKLLLPFFNSVSNQNLELNFLKNWGLYSGLFLITLITGLLTGSYPALLISSFQPANVLKGKIRTNFSAVFTRKFLVVFQFGLSITFITGTIVLSTQIKHMQNKNLGFEKDNIVNILFFKDRTMRDRLDTFKDELLKNPNIISTAACGVSPGYDAGWTSSVRPEGFPEDQKFDMSIFCVDQDFFKTFDIQFKDGRTFRKTTEMENAVVINEEAAKIFGWESTPGKQIFLEMYDTNVAVVGVVKNFHFESMRKEIAPYIFYYSSYGLSEIAARLRPENIKASMDYIEKTWNKFSPNFTFWYDFVDERIDRLYREEMRYRKILNFSTSLTILIAFLGLFGLASFTAEMRTKEVGIRKVLGASISKIIFTLYKDFLVLIIISNAIAWPVSYYIMNRWLQNFAYHINFSLVYPLMAGILSILIAILTVSYQSIKAALANPVESLRYE